MNEETYEFRGIEKRDGEWQAIYGLRTDSQAMLVTQSEIFSCPLPLETRESAYHAVSQANAGPMTTRERAETFMALWRDRHQWTDEEWVLEIERAINAAGEEKDNRITELEAENAELKLRLGRLVEVGHTSAN